MTLLLTAATEVSDLVIDFIDARLPTENDIPKLGEKLDRAQ